MLLRTMSVVILGVVCASGVVVRAAETVMLRPTFTQGDSKYIELDQQVVMKRSGRGMPGGSMTINIRRIYGFIQEVKATSPAKTYLNLTFDRVSQKIDAGSMMDFYFDSDAPYHEDTKPLVAAAMSPMLGQSLQIELDEDLHVTTASGMIPLRTHLTKEAGENLFLRQFIWPELDDTRARVFYGESRFALYPNKEVKVGDEWTRTFTDKNPQIGEARHTYNCKLDRISEEAGRKVAVITFEGTVANKELAPGTTPSADQMKIDGQSTGTGTFDIDQGIIVKSVLEGKTKIRPLGENGEEAKDGVKIDLDIKTTWTVTPAAERAKIKEENARAAEAAKKAEAEKKAARKKANAEKKDADSPDEQSEDDEDNE